MKKTIYYITLLVFSSLFCSSALYCVTAELGSLRAETADPQKTCTIYTGEIELVSFSPVLISEGRTLFPRTFHSEKSGDCIKISGSFTNAAFSGWFVLGNKGIYFIFRCYSGRKESDLFSVKLKSNSFEFHNRKANRYTSHGHSLVVNSPLSSREAGEALISLRPVHFTGGKEGGIIWGGMIKDTHTLPVLIKEPVLGDLLKKSIPFTFHAYIVDSADNPYKDRNTICTFTAPSGKKTIVKPFFSQEFIAGKDTVSEKGNPYFAFRFCPQEEGRYRYTITAGDRYLDLGRFNVVGSNEKGFIQGGQGSRYFSYKNGEIFFPVGLNVAWSDDIIGYLDKCALNGINFIRLWLCTWSLNIEGRNLYDYRLDMCQKLDEVFMHAQKKNIKIMLCINNFYDFKNNKDQHGYFKEGGLCKKEKDFFTDSACLNARKDFYRYLVNRYSAYPSLLSWELWNEVNYAVSDYEVNIASSQDYMARFLKSIDPYKHPVTTSLGWNNVDYDLWDKESIDIVQFHSYVPEFNILPKYSDYMDIAVHIKKNVEDFAAYNKPILISEIGHNGTNEYNPNNDLDAEGVMLHNSLWASSLSGFSGSAMHWWWDVYIDKNSLLYHYAPLAKVLAKYNFTPDMKPISSENIYKDLVRVMGLKNKNGCILWVQDKKAAWGSIHLKSYVPVRFGSVKIRIGKFNAGTYRIEWVNTFSGEKILSEKKTTHNRMILLDVPPFTRDAACVVKKIK